MLILNEHFAAFPRFQDFGEVQFTLKLFQIFFVVILNFTAFNFLKFLEHKVTLKHDSPKHFQRILKDAIFSFMFNFRQSEFVILFKYYFNINLLIFSLKK